jgi:hypothetical protein
VHHRAVPCSTESNHTHTPTYVQVFELLQKEVGTTEVLKVYEFVRKTLGDKRQRRREERKLALVLDPEKVAQQRMDKHTKKINSKKRKIDKQAAKRGKFGKRTKERRRCFGCVVLCCVVGFHLLC